MEIDPASARTRRSELMDSVLREDLDLYGVEELEVRIGRLQAEADRTRAALGRKRSGRAAADALFSFRGEG